MSAANLPTVEVMGLNLARVTPSQVLDCLADLIGWKKPAYFITANVNYAMLTARHPRLRQVNDRAAFILADGMPLVWGSKIKGKPLPGRVTGADLTPAICAMAAERGYSVYILGAEPAAAEGAMNRLQSQYPGLKIVGTDSPELAALSPTEHDQMLARIRAARPQLVFVAFGQPKGDLWIADHYEKIGPAVCVQVGASIDFAAGRVRRAPRWMQSVGLEWAYRLYQEPVRLGSRYAANARFVIGALAASTLTAVFRPSRQSLPIEPSQSL